jgi:dephospho-CoA kinase
LARSGSGRLKLCQSTPGFTVKAVAGAMSWGLNELTRIAAKRKKPVIGLVGGIGAGKTSVAQILESLGAAVVDSDRLGHEQLRDPEVIATLREWWGESILLRNGEIDRRAIGAIVFDDAAMLARLERLLYPRIERRRRELMAAHSADPRVKAIVIDAPKLFEAAVDRICDAVLYVDAEWSLRVRRVADSRGWTEDELARRENLQNPLDMKRVNADYVVKNNSSVDELRAHVERVFLSMLASYA